MSSAVVVLVTASDPKQARRIAKSLVKEKLAACVNILPGVTSHYRWQRKIETSKEVLLMIKTLRSRYPALEKRVRQLHSYDVPEIIMVPILKGNADYLRWIKECA